MNLGRQARHLRCKRAAVARKPLIESLDRVEALERVLLLEHMVQIGTIVKGASYCAKPYLEIQASLHATDFPQ